MTYKERKERARQEAIDWQYDTMTEKPLSYSELEEAEKHFSKLGKRYGLLKEFMENGIPCRGAEDDFETHATLCLSNYGGISLMVNNRGEAVRWQWYDEKPSKRWQAIKYTASGEPFVIIHGRRYRLGDFTKVS